MTLAVLKTQTATVKVWRVGPGQGTPPRALEKCCHKRQGLYGSIIQSGEQCPLSPKTQKLKEKDGVISKKRRTERDQRESRTPSRSDPSLKRSHSELPGCHL